MTQGPERARTRARARVRRPRARAREHAALFGSREERAGEAGLPLLALLTLISLFSSKMWDGRQSGVLVCRGKHSPRRLRFRLDRASK
jgi:hypothetical protein